ncbi:MAG: hypothetical protein WD738_20825 [Pirellulales bacterium]
MSRYNHKSLRKFEALEDRRMMAGDISFNEANGILTITGAGFDDVVEVRFEGDEVKVDLEATEDDGTGTDDESQTENIADVTKIVFNGLAGNDKLTVFVDELDAGVTVNNVVLEFNGGNNDDELVQNGGGIKTTALGGLGNDKLEGSRFNDVLDGGANNDTYVYRGRSVGTDEIREAANVGVDTLDFSGFDTFVNVNLATVSTAANPQSFATAFISNMQLRQLNSTGIENVIGSAFTDHITGNSRPNHLKGGAESDRLAGAGGNDILEGEAGGDVYEFSGTGLGTDDIIEAANSEVDTLRFGGMTSGVTVAISRAGSQFAVDSANLRLRLSSATAIENVFGTAFGDTITGNSRDNRLSGLDGADTIVGGIGADTLQGGAGIDTLRSDALDQVFGGTGRDFFDGMLEVLGTANPRPGRYMDWGTL